MILDIVSVTVKPDYELLLEFENGEHRRFNMANYIDQKPWYGSSREIAFMVHLLKTVQWFGQEILILIQKLFMIFLFLPKVPETSMKSFVGVKAEIPHNFPNCIEILKEFWGQYM